MSINVKVSAWPKSGIADCQVSSPGAAEKAIAPIIHVEKSPKNRIYITHTDYLAIWDAALVGKDGRPTPSGPRLQCYMDLCYLLYQRSTEIRLLKKNMIDLARMQIEFTPTKTERSSGASVIVTISQEMEIVIRRAMQHSHKDCPYLLHTDESQSYTTNGIGTAFRRATERGSIEGIASKSTNRCKEFRI